jgi:hypothetical protein
MSNWIEKYGHELAGIYAAGYTVNTAQEGNELVLSFDRGIENYSFRVRLDQEPVLFRQEFINGLTLIPT